MTHMPNLLAITVCDESDRLKPMFTFTCDRLSTRSDANGGGFVLTLQCDGSATVWAAAHQNSSDGCGRAHDRADDLAHTVAWAVDHPSDDGSQILPFSSDWSIRSVCVNPLI